MVLLRLLIQNGRGSRRCFRCLGGLFGGGFLLQTTGGCQESLSNFADALGQPVATGISSGLSNLVQALVVGLFI